MPIDTILYLLSFILFILAAAPIPTAGWRLEWIAVALLVLSLIV
jgi:hypothetical protein